MSSSLRQYTPATIHHSHGDHHQIVLPVEGVLHLDIEHHYGGVAAGTGALITAGQMHAFSAETHHHFLVLDHEMKANDDILWDQALEQPYLALSPDLQALCQYGVQSYQSGLPDHLLMQWQNLLISSLAFQASRPNKQGMLPARLSKACRYMEANLGRSVTNAEIAEHIHLSQSRFESLFKTTTGTTPQGWMTKRRIDMACELIRQGYPLKTIAQDMGFSDQSAFGKAFKKIKNQSPNQFKSHYFSSS